jgi:hypothetical protein
MYVMCVCSVRLYLQLFVGGHMSYVRYVCLSEYSNVQHIHYVTSFPVLDLFDCPFGIL